MDHLRQLHDRVAPADNSTSDATISTSHTLQRAVLRLTAIVGARAQSVEGRLLTLALLVNDLAAEPDLSATAAELLLHVAHLRGCSLRALIMGNETLLEYLGRRLVSNPAEVNHLAALMRMDVRALVAEVARSVLPRLVQLGAEPEIDRLAELLDGRLAEPDAPGSTVSASSMDQKGLVDPRRRMMVDACPQVLGMLLTEYNRQDQWPVLSGHIGFLERLVGVIVDEMLGSFTDEVTTQILLRQAGRSGWPTDGALELPEPVVVDCKRTLNALKKVHLNRSGQGGGDGSDEDDDAGLTLGEFLSGSRLVGILHQLGERLQMEQVRHGLGDALCCLPRIQIHPEGGKRWWRGVAGCVCSKSGTECLQGGAGSTQGWKLALAAWKGECHCMKTRHSCM